ncbi:MAG TPA: hypothetical protein VG056_01920, partial [Pirellulales bacterium]|nr:hypothetical protein [Pirellulales bacterium]
MTDNEIISLVESKLPQELSLEEIDLIRRRMRASPTVRRALAAQLELDQYLAGLIGKIDLSPDAIFSSAGRSSRFGKPSILSWLGWTACILMMGFVVSILVYAFVIRPNNEAATPKVAQNGDLAESAAVESKPRKAQLSGNDSAAAKVNETTAATAPNSDQKGPAVNPPRNGPKLPVDPAATVGGGKHDGTRIEIAAAAVSRMDHLELDTTEYGQRIGGVLTGGEHGWAEFDFNVPIAGKYRLELCYAAAEPRPLKVSLNGSVVKERAATDVTGNGFPDGQRWSREGVFRLRQGRNTLRLEAEGPYPHLSRLAFVQVVGEANFTGPMAPRLEPWFAKENLGAAPRPMEEIAFDQFDALASAPSLEEMRRWFTPGENGRIDLRDFYGGRIPLIEGRLRLNAPLSEDSVLRLSVYEAQGLSLSFWRGNRGLALRSYDNKGALAAYAISGPDRSRPARVLAASDDDRNWRTNPPLWPLRMDIRFRSGLMVVSRGDVELLRVPYDGVPDDVIFEGHAIVQGMALVRTTSGLPAEPSDRPIAVEVTRPADLKWESHLPNGMSANKLDDGSVELKSQHSRQPGWIAFPLPTDGLGLHELIVEVDDVTPGSNVGLGSLQNDPKPKASVGFFRDSNSGGLSFRWNSFGDASMDFGVDYHGGAGAAIAASHFWLKFIGGCGLKCYTSIDGTHWARLLQPLDAPSYPFTHLMLWSPQSDRPRGIRLRRMTLRKLEAIESLAPSVEIMAQAPTIPIPDFARWEADVGRQKPASVGVGEWRRACALKTLAAGGSVW